MYLIPLVCLYITITPVRMSDMSDLHLVAQAMAPIDNSQAIAESGKASGQDKAKREPSKVNSSGE